MSANSERIRERVRAGLARAKAQGRTLGRRRAVAPPVAIPKGFTVRAAAQAWGVSKSTAAKWITEGRLPAVGQTSSREPTVSPDSH
jgi:DNA invertase Pin-like site-specific DNA recombinase